MGTRVLIQGVRISYPHLAQPRAVQAGDTPKYGAAFLIPKGHPAIAQLLQAAANEMGARWGATPPPTLKPLPMYDGDTDPKYNTVPANNGHMILNTSALDQPHLVDQNNVKLVPNTAGQVFYAGAVVDAFVSAYPYGDKPGSLSKGIAAGLDGVRFVQDGDRLDNRPSAEEMFGAPAGAPAPIAPGIQQGAPAQLVQQPVQSVAPAGVPQPQYAPPPPAGTPYPAGIPTTAAPVAPQPAGAPSPGGPAFLG